MISNEEDIAAGKLLDSMRLNQFDWRGCKNLWTHGGQGLDRRIPEGFRTIGVPGIIVERWLHVHNPFPKFWESSEYSGLWDKVVRRWVKEFVPMDFNTLEMEPVRVLGTVKIANMVTMDWQFPGGARHGDTMEDTIKYRSLHPDVTILVLAAPDQPMDGSPVTDHVFLAVSPTHRFKFFATQEELLNFVNSTDKL